MSCEHPFLAVNRGKRDDGKMNVLILTQFRDATDTLENARLRYEKFGHELMLIPCGKCPSCIAKRRKEWAIRCEYEARKYQDNCFLTLTYDDKHYPRENYKEDFQDFIKALRNKGIKCRYFGCGERGSRSARFHLHIIVFGFMPGDLKTSHKSDSGFWQYKSKTISDIWNKGLCTVAEFSPETAAYVAGYVDKKLNSIGYDDSFILMSKRPGIGADYINSHIQDFYKDDNIVCRFGSHVSGVPRYIDKQAEAAGLDIESVKNKRIECAKNNSANMMRLTSSLTEEDLLFYNKQINDAKRLRNKRSL